jgi:hypothetical protein
VLYAVPKGTHIREETITKETETEDGWKTRLFKDVFSFTLQAQDAKGEPSDKTVQVPRDENVRIIPATAVPMRYQTFDSSQLSCTVEAAGMFARDRKDYDFQLR